MGEQRRVGVVVGARGGMHSAHVTRAGGAAGAAGRAAFGRRQVMLHHPGWLGRWKVGGEGGVPWRDRVPVDGDEALVGLRHGHGRPGLNRAHLARGGDGLGRVEVTCSRGGSSRVAGVAEVAHGAGAQRGGLGGGVASTARGSAGAGVGGQPLPGSQPEVDVLEARSARWSLLPALRHQTIKPERHQRKVVVRQL